MTVPAVTVLIDTYNHERFIEEAIVSVLEQDFPASEIEILVVDDGSTDATPDIVRTFGPRVRLIRKQNGGQASAFNVGIPEARGEIIAFLDGDDWWVPGKLSRLVEYFRAHPDVSVVGHAIYQSDTVTGRTVQTAPLAEREISFWGTRATEDAAFFRRMMCFFGASRLAIRRGIAMRALPIPESIVIEADEYLCIAAIAHSRGALLADPLTFYRLHEENLFQIRRSDPQKLRRMQSSLASLVKELAPRLASIGIQQSEIATLLDPVTNSARRIKLQLDGGMPWETFAAERAERRYSYSGGSLGYRVYALVSLGISLFVPPRQYYAVREWYSASSLRRMRGILGEPVRTSAIENVPWQSSMERFRAARGVRST
jgi:glycosyltransferase involved in cell wall biosynthesis